MDNFDGPVNNEGTMSAENATAEIELEQSQVQLSEEDKKALLNEAIEKNEKLAESELELARWFIENDRLDFALRRLKKILKAYPLSSHVPEAKRLLKQLKAAS